LQSSQHGSQIEEVAPRCFAQHPKGADEGQAAPSGFAASVGVIEQELIGTQLSEGRRVEKQASVPSTIRPPRTTRR